MIGKLWTAFDGKKTTIGGALLIASTFADQVVIGMWDVTSDLLARGMQTADWLGLAMGGTGLGHKVAKYATKQEK